MIRTPDRRQLEQLLVLAKLKESLAQVEMSRSLAAMAKLDREVSELASQTHVAEMPEEVARLQKWQIWRNEKLRKLAMSKSRYAAEHREVAKRLGRLSAEKEVIAEILSRAQKAEAFRKAQRANYVS